TVNSPLVSNSWLVLSEAGPSWHLPEISSSHSITVGSEPSLKFQTTRFGFPPSSSDGFAFSSTACPGLPPGPPPSQPLTLHLATGTGQPVPPSPNVTTLFLGSVMEPGSRTVSLSALPSPQAPREDRVPWIWQRDLPVPMTATVESLASENLRTSTSPLVPSFQ